MKKRIYFIIFIISLMIILTPIVFIVFQTQGRSTYAAIFLMVLSYLMLFYFGGVAKTIVYLIYGVVTFVLLLFFGEYQFPFILIGTLLMVINPLASFENYLNVKISDELTQSFQFSLVNKRNIYNLYHRDMKDALHLPQVRKLFTDPKYKFLRQLTYVIVTTITIFVFIGQLNTMIQTIESFSITSFFSSTYAIIVLIVVNMLIYRKGFTTATRYLIILLFPPVLYFVSIANLELVYKIVMIVTTSLIMLFFIIRESINYFQRVVYETYQYYDKDLQQEVYANALFEPYVYNEQYVEEFVYKIPVNKTKFDKIFNTIKIYANYYRFFIVTYTVSKEQVTLYCHFKSSQHKRSNKFLTFLESLVDDKISYEHFYDPGKTRYEKLFYHKDDYIVSRTLYLVDLLKDLEVKSEVILNIFIYFGKNGNLPNFMKEYPVVRLHDYDFDSNRVVLVSLQISNTEYLIEITIRNFLLSLMINQGKFIRINVEYNDE